MPRTVADDMLTSPVEHAAGTSVAEARAALDDAHRHLVLLVADGVLLGTLTRPDLADPSLDIAAPALGVARLVGRTTAPDEPLEPVRAAMLAAGERRRAVVDPAGRLLGLLCLKASGSGFCSDDGVAARAASRLRS